MNGPKTALITQDWHTGKISAVQVQEHFRLYLSDSHLAVLFMPECCTKVTVTFFRVYLSLIIGVQPYCQGRYKLAERFIRLRAVSDGSGEVHG